MEINYLKNLKSENLNYKLGIPLNIIENGTDLNEIVEPGMYTFKSSADGGDISTILNRPTMIANIQTNLRVEKIQNETSVVQIIYSKMTGSMGFGYNEFRRICRNTTTKKWEAWKRLAFVEDIAPKKKTITISKSSFSLYGNEYYNAEINTATEGMSPFNEATGAFMCCLDIPSQQAFDSGTVSVDWDGNFLRIKSTKMPTADITMTVIWTNVVQEVS